MAEERNVGVARAVESDDTDSTKAELQRRMEEARESISQTVNDIKETVTTKYEDVRESIQQTLDWRQYVLASDRKNLAVLAIVGALGFMAIVLRHMTTGRVGTRD